MEVGAGKEEEGEEEEEEVGRVSDENADGLHGGGAGGKEDAEDEDKVE